MMIQRQKEQIADHKQFYFYDRGWDSQSFQSSDFSDFGQLFHDFVNNYFFPNLPHS